MRAIGNLKVCSCCRIEQPLGNFSKNGSALDKLNAWCKVCHMTACAGYRAKRKSVNPAHFKDKAKQPRMKYSNYKSKAKARDIPFNMSFIEFMYYWQLPCHYCGDAILTVGIDRVDNKRGYELGNTVPCCDTCNWTKRDFNICEFLDKCTDVTEYFFKRKKSLRGKALYGQQTNKN